MKRPAFQFYPADWRKDVELRSCSIASRGLWIDMMCIAHECEPYGHLTINGKAMTPVQIAGQVGLSAAQAKKLIDELKANGVARTTTEGVIYSKRMVDDEDLRNRRAAGGKEGAEYGVKGAEAGSKGGRPKHDKGGYETPLPGFEKPPPSSSSSSSTSVEKEPTGSSSPAKLPTCPTQSLIDLYHEILPDLPQVRLATKDRTRALGKAWTFALQSKRPDGSRRAETTEQALQWFRDYFARAAQNDFLMGRTPRSGEHANWRCDLDFLLTDRGMKHVIEKTLDTP